MVLQIKSNFIVHSSCYEHRFVASKESLQTEENDILNSSERSGAVLPPAKKRKRLGVSCSRRWVRDSPCLRNKISYLQASRFSEGLRCGPGSFVSDHLSSTLLGSSNFLKTVLVR